MIRVLVADDRPIVREGLKRILAENNEINVCGEAGTCLEVLHRVSTEEFDVLVLDINMPGGSGLDVLKEVTKEHPEAKVIILSVKSENMYGLKAIKAGAKAYIHKDSAPERLVDAILKVHAGNQYISPELAEILVKEINRNTDKDPHETLSDWEFQVLCKIAEGKTVKTIAEEFNKKPKTISTFRARMLSKTNLRNNSEVTRYAIEHNLLD